MTRRERLERKLEKRIEWAESRDKKAAAGFEKARVIADGIPLGQPILLGHHSEKRHRRDIARINAGMSAGVENSKMASHHRSKADGLECQLDRSIFSDDPDAIKAIRERLLHLEAKRAAIVALRKAWKKAGSPASDDEAGWQKVADALSVPLSDLSARRLSYGAHDWHNTPCPAYETQNLGGNIVRLRKRIEEIEARQERQAKAEAAPCGILIEGNEDKWEAPVRVTFPEKPSREIIEALKAANFRWSGGSWVGGTRGDAKRITNAG